MVAPSAVAKAIEYELVPELTLTESSSTSVMDAEIEPIGGIARSVPPPPTQSPGSLTIVTELLVAASATPGRASVAATKQATTVSRIGASVPHIAPSVAIG